VSFMTCPSLPVLLHCICSPSIGLDREQSDPIFPCRELDEPEDDPDPYLSAAPRPWKDMGFARSLANSTETVWDTPVRSMSCRWFSLGNSCFYR